MDLSGDVILAAKTATDRCLNDPYPVHFEAQGWRYLSSIAEGILSGRYDIQHTR